MKRKTATNSNVAGLSKDKRPEVIHLLIQIDKLKTQVETVTYERDRLRQEAMNVAVERDRARKEFFEIQAKMSAIDKYVLAADDVNKQLSDHLSQMTNQWKAVEKILTDTIQAQTENSILREKYESVLRELSELKSASNV